MGRNALQTVPAHSLLTFSWGKKGRPVRARRRTPLDNGRLPLQTFDPAVLARIRYINLDKGEQVFADGSRTLDSVLPEHRSLHIGLLSLAAHLHAHAFSYAGLTFRFVVAFRSKQLDVGIQVERATLPVEVRSVFDHWEGRSTEASAINGQVGFCRVGKDLSENWFTTSKYEGLSWASLTTVEAGKIKRGLYMWETQECKYFLQAVLNVKKGKKGKLRKKMELLRRGKHLLTAAFEELFPYCGFSTFLGSGTRKLGIDHMYDGLLGKRVEIGPNGKVPLYERVTPWQLGYFSVPLSVSHFWRFIDAI